MKTVYYNALVYTGNGGYASSFIVEDGRFSFVGFDCDSLPQVSEGDRSVDLHGAFVCPGFNDSHMHLLNYGSVLTQAPLGEHTGSLSELLDCLRGFLSSHPKGEGGWLLGRGWNQDLFSDEKRIPTRWDLDSVSTEAPILITRACGHCCVLNSKALALAGISGSTPQPEGGRIGMENGSPNGALYDNAMDLVNGVTSAPDKESIKSMMIAACRELNRYGVTSAQTDDYCVRRDVDPELINEAYRELAAEGLLTVRVYEQCNFTELHDLERFIESGNVTGKGDKFFRIGPLKLLGDGALGSRTAHLSKPYLGTDGCGFSLFSPEHMKELVLYAHTHGMQVAIHAIGDACLDEVLDAIEAANASFPREDHRHGIVHCQISRADQLERIARLGLHVYAQSVFLDYDNHIVGKLVDPEIASTSYNWKTLMNMGVSVSNGSDCPVEMPDVMRGIECAVTRTSLDGTGPFLPEEAFSVREAIDSFTMRSAEASFEENLKGCIRGGMLADFVVLDADPFRIEPSKLHTIKPKAVYFGGKLVYEA